MSLYAVSDGAGFVSPIEEVPDHEGGELGADEVDEVNEEEQGLWREVGRGEPEARPRLVNGGNGGDEGPGSTAAKSGEYIPGEEQDGGTLLP